MVEWLCATLNAAVFLFCWRKCRKCVHLPPFVQPVQSHVYPIETPQKTTRVVCRYIKIRVYNVFCYPNMAAIHQIYYK